MSDETCHEENATQLITHVEVTPSSGSDTGFTTACRSLTGFAERKVSHRTGALQAEESAYVVGPQIAFEASRPIATRNCVEPEGGVRPNVKHMMALLELAKDLGLGHLFTE